MKGKRVFLGTRNIASQLNDWADGFERIGYKTTIGLYGNKHVGQLNDADFDISTSLYYKIVNRIPSVKVRGALKGKYDIRRFFQFLKVALSHDIFFIIKDSLLLNGADLKYLKLMNKKVVVVFTGYERWISATIQEFERKNLQPAPWDKIVPKHDTFNFKMNRMVFLRRAEKYADAVFSLPVNSQTLIRPYYFFRYPLILENFTVNTEQREIPHIVHSPTNREFKGTDFILRAIEELKKESVSFEFNLIENLPYKEAIARMSDSDIIISMITDAGGGKLAREALAMGKVCITNFDGHFEHPEMGKIPVVHADRNSIKDVLRKTIMDFEERKQIAKKSREYAELVCDSAKNAQFVIDILNGNCREEFRPTFYAHYRPKDKVEKDLWNSNLKYVRYQKWFDTDAYK